MVEKFRLGVVGYCPPSKFDEVEARSMVIDGFDKFAEKHPDAEIDVVLGLTNVGVLAIAYEEAKKRKWKTTGIACKKAEENPFPVDEKKIVGENWGDESEVFIHSIDGILRIGGGVQSMREVGIMRDAGKEVVEYELARIAEETRERVVGAQVVPPEKVDIAPLRYLRGDNSAVRRIDIDSGNLLSILRHPKDYPRSALQQAVFGNYSGEAYGDYQWSKKAGGWTTPEVPTLYGKLRSLYPSLAPLSLDPGCITHLPELMELLQQPETDNRDFAGVRERLQESLGEAVVWRGMMLTDAELEDIKSHGIGSSFVDHVEKTENPGEEFEAKILSTYIHEAIESHFHGENRYSPFVSVSAHADVAMAVGRHFGKKTDGRKFYLFKIKMPKIDLLHYADHGLRTPSKLMGSTAKISVSVDDKASAYDWDKNVESYVFWKINPEEILEITQPNVGVSTWSGRKTVG